MFFIYLSHFILHTGRCVVKSDSVFKIQSIPIKYINTLFFQMENIDHIFKLALLKFTVMKIVKSFPLANLHYCHEELASFCPRLMQSLKLRVPKGH